MLKKTIGILVFLSLLCCFAVLQFPQANATTIEQTFTPTNQDSDMQGANSGYTYAQIWGASSCSFGPYPSHSYYIIGQRYSGQYTIFRSCIYFDTSAIPSYATVTSATLSLYMFQDSSDTDFSITLQGTGTYPTNPTQATDYNQALYTGTNYGSTSTAGLSTPSWFNIVLNSDGKAAIVKGGTTRVILRSSNDISETAPTGNEYIQVSSSESSPQDYVPKLVVTYTTPTHDITITSNPSGSGFVTVDGTAYTTPHTFTWLEGTTHTIAATSTVNGATGTRYVYSSWSDSGAQSHTYTTPSSDATVTANYQTQHKLTVTGGNGISYSVASPTGDGWYNEGTTLTVSSNWVWNTVTGQTRVNLKNCQIDGANQNPTRQNIGTYTTPSISMTTAHTVAFSSANQNYLTVTGGHSVTYGTASPTSDNWYDETQSTTITSDWVWDSSGGVRTALSNYALDGAPQNPTRQYSGTYTTASINMGTYHVATFSSVTQRQIAFTSSGISTDTTGTVVTINTVAYTQAQLPTSAWYDDGATVTYSYTSPVAASATKQYVWASTAGVSQTLQSNSFTVSAAGTVTATYTPQYKVTFTTNGLDASVASGTILTVDSTEKAYSDLPYNVWVNNGDSVAFTYNSTIASTTPNQDFEFSSVTQTSPLTVNSAVTVTATYIIHYSYVGGDCNLNIQALDTASNLLSGAQITLNSTTYTAIAGQFNVTGLSIGDYFTGSATWQGLSVNASFSFTITGNMTLPIDCAAYPYEFNSVIHHLATNRTINSQSWIDPHYNLTFASALTPTTLVTDCGQIPTYMLGAAYDITSAWNNTSGVLTLTLQNTTSSILLSFDSWGSGFYIQQIDSKLQSLTWSDQALTFNFGASSSGTLILRCSSRGLPVTITGMPGASYSAATTLLTGIYTAQTSVVVDWTSTSSPPSEPTGPSGDNSGQTTVTLKDVNFGNVNSGHGKLGTLTFSFTGTNINVLSVAFSGTGAEFLNATGLPLIFYGGSGSILVQLNIPAGTASGSYTLDVTLTALDAYGTQKVATGKVGFTVDAPISPENTLGVPQDLTVLVVVIIVIILVIIGTLAIIARRH
jgi:hypothetical protein